MTTPPPDAPASHVPAPPPTPAASAAPSGPPDARSPYARAAIWVAIGALVAAALICVVWVLIGAQGGSIVRAFMTVALFAGFAGIAIMEARLAPRRPAWFAIASITTWVVALLAGIVLIWMPDPWSFFGWGLFGPDRFVRFLLVVLVLQLALLHARFFLRIATRHLTSANRVLAPITVGLVGLLALMLLIPLVIGEWITVSDFYWRVVVALLILAAVGTALVPLLNVLFAPRATGVSVGVGASARPASPAPATRELLPWPMYVDGVTPLPMLPDGSPDWNAYYTGHPTPGAQVFPPVGPPAPRPAPAPQTAPAPAPASAPATESAPSTDAGTAPSGEAGVAAADEHPPTAS